MQVQCYAGYLAGHHLDVSHSTCVFMSNFWLIMSLHTGLNRQPDMVTNLEDTLMNSLYLVISSVFKAPARVVGGLLACLFKQWPFVALQIARDFWKHPQAPHEWPWSADIYHCLQQHLAIYLCQFHIWRGKIICHKLHYITAKLRCIKATDSLGSMQ